MAEHDNFVNSCCPLRRGPPLLVSGSDDGTAKARSPGPGKFSERRACPAPAAGGGVSQAAVQVMQAGLGWHELAQRMRGGCARVRGAVTSLGVRGVTR